jgi:hypothetical protein
MRTFVKVLLALGAVIGIAAGVAYVRREDIKSLTS